MSRRIFHITSTTSRKSESWEVTNDDADSGLPTFFAARIERPTQNNIKSRMQNNLIHLSWQTTAEPDTCYFELQRSSNGRDYDSVETIIAEGNSEKGGSYSVGDARYSFFNDKLYYRLKVVFISGVEAFTDDLAIDISRFATTAVYSPSYSWSQQ